MVVLFYREEDMKMKKIIALLLATMMVLSLAACDAAPKET